MEKPKAANITFTEEDDIEVLENVKKGLYPTHGKVSTATAVRIALRQLASDLKTKGEEKC